MLLWAQFIHPLAQVVKLVDTRDLKSLAARHTGSIPVLGTQQQITLVICFSFYTLYGILVSTFTIIIYFRG